MSRRSEEPFYAPFRAPAPPRQPKPGERLFELFFVSGNSVSVVNVNAAAGLIPGEPRRLFSWQRPYIFDVMPDSRRFVMVEGQPAPVPSQINLVLGGLVDVGRR